MAEICLAYSITPAQFRSMTLAELDAFRWLLKQIQKERGK